MLGSLGGVLNLRPRLWLLSFRGARITALSSPPQERDWCERLPAGVGGRYGASRALLRQQLSQHLGCEPLAVPLHSPPGEAPSWRRAGAGSASPTEVIGC